MARPPYSHFPFDSLLPSSSSAGSDEADVVLLHSSTAKRFKPGSPGTRRLLKCYWRGLPCVRYRVDHATGKRFTTVELVVDESSGAPAATVWVRIGYGETDWRRQIKEAGGAWDAERKLWRVSPPISQFIESAKTDRQGFPLVAITTQPLLAINIHIWQQIAKYGWFSVSSTTS